MASHELDGTEGGMRLSLAVGIPNASRYAQTLKFWPN